MKYLLALLLAAPALAAEPDPRQIFAPLDLQPAVSAYRSGSGLPGPAYWQNRADYAIAAMIDTRTNVLTGHETITYTNNSPDALPCLWLYLEQNADRADARAAIGGEYPRGVPGQGEQLDSVTVKLGAKASTPVTRISDTRLQIVLPTPLPAHSHLQITIAWHYTVPAKEGRTAVAPSRNGPIYDIAQWYPRMAVYDDLRGWDTLPYLGAEFYLEYGDFDYTVTVPAGYVVAGSGALTNPDVLSAAERSRLAAAARSDAAVMIRTPAEVAAQAAGPAPAGTRTWHFHMNNTRDVVFAASPAFVWDAARINLPGGKSAMAMSVYPVESQGAAKWGRSTEYVKGVIEYFSRQWFAYPWPNAINVAGPVGGMEYPGVVFDSTNDAGKNLFWITAHEIGHSYFPMIVGSNERRWAFMDEGFNTFIDVYASDAFEGGVYGPKRDVEYAPGTGTPSEQIAKLLADPAAPTILTPADSVAEKYRHPVEYFKPALGLVLLREQILGAARFDDAFRHYIAAWAYKHPDPADFFRLMSSDGGEDLSWWWRGWYFNNWSMDLRVGGVSYNGDPAKGADVTLENHGWLVMPALLRAKLAGGGVVDVRLPVEMWRLGNRQTVHLATTQKLDSVTLDPDHALPQGRPGAPPLDPARGRAP